MTDEDSRKKIVKSPKEWSQELPKDVFDITRKKATEQPYTGQYHNFNEEGRYCCRCCATPLFESEDKFNAGCGWPSFYNGYQDNLKERSDYSWLKRRTEVLCKTCDAHLGHVFNDGPLPTGVRYCINSAALAFEPR